MKNYLINLQYDGSKFYGWAKQEKYTTVQGELEKYLLIFCNEKITIHGSGRTDKYVHALDQYCHFALSKKEIKDFSGLICFLEGRINGIKVKSIKEVDNKFHSRFNVKNKTYKYKINVGEMNAFQQNYIHQYCRKLNMKKLKLISELFIGEHNFQSFSTTTNSECNRLINWIKISKQRNIVEIEINGKGFLRNMVRMIVGNLIACSEGKRTEDQIKQLLKNPKKGASIYKAPGCGLYLFEVSY